MLELARLRRRGLLRFIEKTLRNPVYTNFEDVLGDGVEVALPGVMPGTNYERFKSQAKACLREHLDDLALPRLRRNKQLTPEDSTELEQMLVASRGQQVDSVWANEQNAGLGIFVRGLVGLDHAAAMDRLRPSPRRHRVLGRASAIRQLDRRRATKNGVMEPKRFFESPYTDHAPTGPGFSPTPTLTSSSRP